MPRLWGAEGWWCHAQERAPIRTGFRSTSRACDNTSECAVLMTTACSGVYLGLVLGDEYLRSAKEELFSGWRMFVTFWMFKREQNLSDSRAAETLTLAFA